MGARTAGVLLAPALQVPAPRGLLTGTTKAEI